MKNCVMILINKSNYFKTYRCIILPIRLNKTLFCTFSDESMGNEDEEKLQKKKKIIVYRKQFSIDPNNPTKILEWKSASQVVKRLNWENKNLFGPILHPKNDRYNNTKINEYNEIVQHRTTFPIEEPCDSSSSKPKLHTDTKRVTDAIQTFDFNTILYFPLLNKLYCSMATQVKINEINTLRKYLETKSNLIMPSVSAILEKTMSKESIDALAHWKQNMIDKLGEAGFQKYRTELLQNGAALHSNINSYLSATPEKDILIEESNLGHWKSLKSVFPRLTDIKLLEERVTHPFLCYKGVVDCFARYRDHLVVIDWKTSKRTKASLSSTYDNPLQIAAYVGALNFDPKFQYLVSKGLIVVAYESGMPANALYIDEEKMKKYWKEWLKRVKLYWETIDSSQ